VAGMLDGAAEYDSESGRSRKREECEVSEQQDGISVTYFGEKIESPEKLIEHAKIDLRIWEVSKVTVNNWGVGGKIKRGQDDNGKWRPEQLWQQSLRQIKVELRRRAPKFIQDAIVDLLASWKPRKLAALNRKPFADDAHMAEIALHDAHFGKLCWAMETGTDFDLKIIESDFCGAVDDLLARIAHFPVDRITLPVGSDLFQVDNLLGTTTKGTRVDATDDRLSKVFDVVARSVEYAIRRCREVADVDVFWMPGNHDYTVSWYLVRVLEEVFKGDEHVAIDRSPMPHKYRHYGKTLIGYAHGDEVALSKLPLIMATDQPDLWAQSVYRHWKTGDKHKRAKFNYTAGDTFNGVEVFICPSLSGTDLWHYRKGYVNNIRMAECFLYSKVHGPVGQFVVPARSNARR
jgi:hypothetical protein